MSVGVVGGPRKRPLPAPASWRASGLYWSGARLIYCDQIRVFQTGASLNTFAWNNKIRCGVFSVG